MSEDLDAIIAATQKRVEDMRRLTDETTRLLGESKKAEEELASSTQHIQERYAKERPED